MEEMLLFEKIAYLEKEAKGGKIKGPRIPRGATTEEVAAAFEKWDKKQAEKAAKKNNVTLPDGTKVDKTRYPGVPFDRLSPPIESTPFAGYMYANPATAAERAHNDFVRSYYTYKPGILERLNNAWNEHARRADNRRMFEMQMEGMDRRHRERMTQSNYAMQVHRGLAADRHRISDMQGLAMLGGGGALGGGALLVSNRQQQPPYIASPMYYEQDYYH